MSRNPTPIESLLLPLKPESLQCLHRFIQHEPAVERRRYPKKRTAAVAIILFVGRLGDLYVLLSTRAGDMRTYAQDTALPGGKYEEGDVDTEGTARREAFEEIGLPMDREKVRKLCLLDPFLTGNSLIVTPQVSYVHSQMSQGLRASVVFLVTDNTINPILNPSEVAHLFSMPLPAFLHHRPSRIPGWQFRSHRIDTSLGTVGPPPPVPYANQPRPTKGGEGDGDDEDVGGGEGRYYQYRDVAWGEPGRRVRMHRFLTGREGGGVKPVYGLTAAILIHAAMIGYDQQPTFERYAPDQRSMTERIEWEIRHGGGALRRAVEADGLLADWEAGKAKL